VAGVIDPGYSFVTFVSFRVAISALPGSKVFNEAEFASIH
jgi:hypothetical protein